MKTTKTMSGADSFIRGWNYGKANGRELSAREIEMQFPDVDDRAFAQGNIDGMLDDWLEYQVEPEADVRVTTPGRGSPTPPALRRRP